MKKLYIRFVCCVMLVWLSVMASCRDEVVMTNHQSTDCVMFTVSGDTAATTSLGLSRVVTERHFLGMAGKDSVFVSLIEEPNDALLKNDKKHSRGISFTSGNLSSFSLTAYVEDGSEFMKNQGVTKNEDNDKWEYSPVKYWPQEQSVHFFGYAKMNDCGVLSTPEFSIRNNGYIGMFNYTLPDSENKGQDAVGQPDLVFAFTPDKSREVVHLSFRHALSAILFKIAGVPDDITLTDLKITLDSAVKGGRCNLMYQNESLSFDWSELDDEKGTYAQDFKYVKEAVSGLSYDENESQTFMMIPQALTDAKLVVAFNYKEMNYEFEKNLKDIHTQWEANKKYTYVISISETVEVHISDKVNGNVKSEVIIKNTGLSDAYIRATIVGYWENEAGDVVDWWDFGETNGIFVKATLWNNYWIKQGDFYYYKYPIKVGDTPTVPLFDTYTLERKDTPTDAKLKLNVVVQAVKYESGQESLKKAWGDDVAQEISPDFEQINQGE